MSSDYQIWLTYNGEKEKMQFPVHPESIDISIGSNNRKINVSGLGEVTIMQEEPAAVISFSSFFPSKKFQGVVTKKLFKPEKYIEILKKWKAGRKPSHFLITGTKINMFCTIENLKYSENGGDVGTLSYSITLKEYREVSVRQITVNQNSGVASLPSNVLNRTDNREQPLTHKVIVGDCLWSIAHVCLGDGSRWKEIYELNKELLGYCNVIYAGQILVLPK